MRTAESRASSRITPGLVLIAAAAIALAVANSPAGPALERFWAIRAGPFDLRQWIDDGLMAVFFFHVGLEMKREIVAGDLSTATARRMPVVAAACGMAMPAAVYLLATGFAPALARGWAIPAATDIAFALGVLALLGDRAPAALRLLLTGIAIADDVGAVAIIAFGYTGTLAWGALAGAAAIVAGLWLLARRGVSMLWPYALLSVALWAAVHRSGVHATVAGVLAALFVPLHADDAPGPLERAERTLAPWVSYLVLPAFGLANAGVRFGTAPLLAPLPLAIAAGLFLGKQAGVFAALRGMAALGLADRPAGTTWPQLYGMALLAGIGFTMSLFIAGLAFDDPVLREQAKAGILLGSLLSAVAGYAVLRLSARRSQRAG